MLSLGIRKGNASIHLGMTTARVQSILSAAPTAEERPSDSFELVLFYEELGLEITFDDDLCVAIHAASTTTMDILPTFDGVPLLDVMSRQALIQLGKIDPNFLITKEIYKHIYSPSANIILISEGLTSPILSIRTFDESYFDPYLEEEVLSDLKVREELNIESLGHLDLSGKTSVEDEYYYIITMKEPEFIVDIRYSFPESQEFFCNFREDEATIFGEWELRDPFEYMLVFSPEDKNIGKIVRWSKSLLNI